MERVEFYDKVKELAAARGLEFAEITSGCHIVKGELRSCSTGKLINTKSI